MIKYKDATAAERVKRFYIKRKMSGWKEVRVWVPDAECARRVRALAASMRATARDGNR